MKRIFISVLLFAGQAVFGAQLQLNPGDPPHMSTLELLSSADLLPIKAATETNAS